MEDDSPIYTVQFTDDQVICASDKEELEYTNAN